MKPFTARNLGLLLLALILCAPQIAKSQEPVVNQADTTIIHVVIKNDGTQFVGKIISRDSRELLIVTQNLGEIVIPMHEIREIREAKVSEVSTKGEYIPAEVFSTRYFITTNGLPIVKGESYIQWNIYGPDFQFGVSDNFGAGVMTTWFGTPIIGTAKYSIDLPGKASAGVGLLAGTGSWAAPDFGLLLPFGVFTLGDRVNNINVSFGYGGVFYKESDYDPIRNRDIESRVSDGRFLFSIAAMVKAGRKLSLVFDSFIVPRGGYYDYTEYVYFFNPTTGYDEYRAVTRKKRRGGLTLLIPGIRLQTDPNKAFQFGFGGAYVDGELIPTPIPMLQWYRKL
jgi:hypothetical protein